jgi:hypothetical protein
MHAKELETQEVQKLKKGKDLRFSYWFCVAHASHAETPLSQPLATLRL